MFLKKFFFFFFHVIGPCSSDPCANGGTCTVTNQGGITCRCASGFEGPRCETGTLYKREQRTF